MAGALICGSAVIEDGVELSPGSIVRDKCRVGAGARVGLGAVVVSDVREGDTVVGLPARSFSRNREV
jgi:serine acetyltransferase